MSGSAPGGPRRLAGEADREQLVALLREHYALGQLDDDELDRRVGVVLSARYMDEAASAVADLPLLRLSPVIRKWRSRRLPRLFRMSRIVRCARLPSSARSARDRFPTCRP